MTELTRAELTETGTPRTGNVYWMSNSLHQDLYLVPKHVKEHMDYLAKGLSIEECKDAIPMYPHFANGKHHRCNERYEPRTPAEASQFKVLHARMRAVAISHAIFALEKADPIRYLEYLQTHQHRAAAAFAEVLSAREA